MRSLAIRAAYAAAICLLVAQVVETALHEREQARQPSSPDPAFARVADNPNLPRVLLIGDSISIGYTVPTRELLAGKANVHRIPVNGGPTTRGLEHLEKWLRHGKWDVVHFNWGLHDLRTQPDGKVQVSLDDYRLNLEELVRRMEKTGPKLIWATTTPVPNAKLNPPRKNSDVLAYNDVARQIMDEHQIAIDDLYALAAPQLDRIQQPDDVNFTSEGSRILAEQVSARILVLLEQKHGKPED